MEEKILRTEDKIAMAIAERNKMLKDQMGAAEEWFNLNVKPHLNYEYIMKQNQSGEYSCGFSLDLLTPSNYSYVYENINNYHDASCEGVQRALNKWVAENDKHNIVRMCSVRGERRMKTRPYFLIFTESYFENYTYVNFIFN